eukprot:gb/GECH01009499.1/.p1 GENE.gb/GECH01009499.1/~~gb/GECH01009499.1/.p1  ORF type:complete len:354 (+),score=49.15 gb/GECH01009499.1/:1-1062(+)
MEEENHDQSNGDNNKHTPNTSSTPFEDRHMDILYSQNQSLKEQLFDECRYLMREVRDLREELSLRESNETELVKMNKLYKKTISNLLQQFKAQQRRQDSPRHPLRFPLPSHGPSPALGDPDPDRDGDAMVDARGENKGARSTTHAAAEEEEEEEEEPRKTEGRKRKRERERNDVARLQDELRQREMIIAQQREEIRELTAFRQRHQSTAATSSASSLSHRGRPTSHTSSALSPESHRFPYDADLEGARRVRAASPVHPEMMTALAQTGGGKPGRGKGGEYVHTAHDNGDDANTQMRTDYYGLKQDHPQHHSHPNRKTTHPSLPWRSTYPISRVICNPSPADSTMRKHRGITMR